MHPRTFRPALCTCLLASSLLLFSTPAAVAKSIAKDDINVRSGATLRLMSVSTGSSGV